MRASSKEELVEFLEEVKDKLEGIASRPGITLDREIEIEDLVSEIKDTLYWA